MRVILLHNVKAGNQEWPAGRLKRLFAKHGHKVVYVSTKDGNWEEGLKQSAQAVAIAGGDGTVGLVALRVAQRKLPFCVLPVGTANNIATSLEHDYAPEKIVAGLAAASEKKLDLGTVTSCRGSSPFIESVGAGILGEMTQMPKQKDSASIAKKLKRARKHLVSMLDDYDGFEGEVLLDGKRTKGRFLAVEIMNIDRIGPNLLLAPKADTSDGWLDAVCITTRDREKLRSYLKAGDNMASPFQVKRCRRAELRCSGAQIHVDDKPIDIPSAKIHLQRAALRFLDCDPQALS